MAINACWKTIRIRWTIRWIQTFIQLETFLEIQYQLGRHPCLIYTLWIYCVWVLTCKLVDNNSSTGYFVRNDPEFQNLRPGWCSQSVLFLGRNEPQNVYDQVSPILYCRYCHFDRDWFIHLMRDERRRKENRANPCPRPERQLLFAAVGVTNNLRPPLHSIWRDRQYVKFHPSG